MTKFEYIFRHLFLFALFIFFAKHALDRSFEHIKKEKFTTPSPWETFDVHELDKNFLRAIQETRKQVNYVVNIFGQKPEDNTNISTLRDMLVQLDEIEKKYTKNSPATFLLGPLGTTAIVLKEQRLERHLLGIIADLGNILYVLHNKTHTAQEGTPEKENIVKVASIEAGIVTNNKLLSEIC